GPDPSLRPIERSRRDEIPSRLGAKQIRQLKRDDPVAEVRRDSIERRRATVEAAQDERARIGLAAPLRAEGKRRENVPAVTVRDRERQAAIRVVVDDAVHPGARLRSGANRRRISIDGVAGQLHLRESSEACGTALDATRPTRTAWKIFDWKGRNPAAFAE